MRDGKRAEKLSLYEDWHVWGLMRAHPLLAYGNERGTGVIRVQHVTPRPVRVIVFPRRGYLTNYIQSSTSSTMAIAPAGLYNCYCLN